MTTLQARHSAALIVACFMAGVLGVALASVVGLRLQRQTDKNKVSEISFSDLSGTAPIRGKAYLHDRAAEYQAQGLSKREAAKKLMEDHLLWSIRDVVRNYGIPNQVSDVGERLFLTYRSVSTASEVFTFAICNGVVCSVEVQV